MKNMKNKKKLVIFIAVIFCIGLLCYLVSKTKNEHENDTIEEAVTNMFEADIYLITKEEGGRHTPIYKEKSFPNLVFDEKYLSTKKFELTKDYLMPGEEGHVIITLQKEYTIKKNDTFIIQEGSRKVVEGTVTKVLELQK